MAKQNRSDTPKKKRKARRIIKRLILTLLILLVLVGAAWYGYESLKAEHTITYQGYNAATGTISNAMSFSGTLQTVNSENHTSPAAATVRTVYVKAGDKVSEGDKLIRLSTGQTLTAGISGTVNQLPVKEGDKVSNGTLLCDVVDFEHMKVSIRVDEYDINQVKPGDACRITTTATENTFQSSVASINYVSSSSGSVAYYTAVAYVDVAPGVYPGMQVTVTIPKEEAKDAVILRMDAISFDSNNRAFVYMMDAGGEMVPVSITTGVSNGSYVEITSGLRAGDTVYAETKTAAGNTLTSMLSSIFGGRNVNAAFGGGSTRNNQGGSTWNNQGGSGSRTPGSSGGGRNQ